MTLDTLQTDLDDKVRAIVAESLGIALSDVTHDSSIITGLGADSLDCIELAMAIEEEFQIDVSDVDMDQVDTVQDLIDLVISETMEKAR